MSEIKTTICPINDLSYQDLALLMRARVLNPAEIQSVYASPYRVIKAEDSNGLIVFMLFLHVPHEHALLITGFCGATSATEDVVKLVGDSIDSCLAEYATKLGCRRLLMVNSANEAVQIRDYIVIPSVATQAFDRSNAASQYLN